MQKNVLATIEELELAIREACKGYAFPHDYMNSSGPLEPRKYEGSMVLGQVMHIRYVAQHALWHLEQAKKSSRTVHQDETQAMHIGIAAGLMFPYGIAVSGQSVAQFQRYPAMGAMQFRHVHTN